MNDEQLLRYSRQIMLPEIDARGQLRLAEATVLIIGLGGLGSPAAIYLAAAGVGHLILVDFDKVDLSNLQRQILHQTPDIGRLKVESARDHLLAINPDVKLTLINHAMEMEELLQQVVQADVVLDASDNFQTRFAINAACVQSKTPLVSGAAIRFEAQLSVFDLRSDASPCYRCLYGDSARIDETCTANGVIAPLLGIAGSIQAMEAMKLIMGIGQSLTGKLLLFDALAMEWHSARLPKDPACPVCGSATHARTSHPAKQTQTTDV
ncbi:MAG: Molybdopterin-synthase adenylyltransferase MoeB [Gammaproteobacteria bacterium]|nr:Molybdopterin-synthase adenylyltransferase MoeB [Gammaproteobacteria bacterium]